MNILLGCFISVNPKAILSTNRINGWHTLALIFALVDSSANKTSAGMVRMTRWIPRRTFEILTIIIAAI
jgi:hypothetical protein